MFKNVSLGVGALTIALTAGMLAMPQKAEARYCQPTIIPYGFVPTTTPCGSPGCLGLYYERDGFPDKCVLGGDPTF